MYAPYTRIRLNFSNFAEYVNLYTRLVLLSDLHYIVSMKLSLDHNTSRYTIRSYNTGEVVVNNERLTRSLIVTPEQLLRDWGPQTVEELELEHTRLVTELNPEIILLGTGKSLHFPRAELISALASVHDVDFLSGLRKQIGVEVMDTAAACRTYNILSAEGRSVAAAILMIQ